MSRVFSAEQLADAQPVTIGALGQARGSVFTARFADGQEVLRPRSGAARQENRTDPVEQAKAEAFAQGFDEGMRVAIEGFSVDEEMKARLAIALEHIAPAANGALSSLLSAAVLRLVTQIVGEVSVDADLLARRVEGVCRFIEEGQSRNSLHLHPEDIAMLGQRDFGFPLTPDDGLSRGSVRLETADGWIEDGPDMQISRLKALLDTMEGQG